MTRLKLDDLEVRSFVTTLPDRSQAVVQGGATVNGPLCSVQVCQSDQICPPGTRTCNDGGTGLECANSYEFGCTHDGCSLTCSYAISDCC